MIPVMRVKTRARVLVVSACCLFVISIFTPFLQVLWRGMGIPEFHHGPENLWSFKETIEYSYMGDGLIRREFWFSEYWFQYWITENEMLQTWVGPILILVLVFQILVVSFSILTIFTIKHKLFLCSAVVFNALVLLCMLFVTYTLYHSYEKYLVLGFWLSFVSVALFVTALFFSRKHDKI